MTVHWIGTGMSTGAVVRELAEPALFWGRDRGRLERRAGQLGLPAESLRVLGEDDLAASVQPGDVVVSMVPAAEHPRLLRLALDAGAHFACSSYSSPEIADLAEEAREQGLVVLTECGLDPGIDHLMGHLLVDRARAEVGDGPAQVDLVSVCGGLPAEPNEFRYRFSWAPRGVLRALESPASYVEDGARTTAERPWEAVRDLDVNGETFEAYPNRDSAGLPAQYGFPDGWDSRLLLRGTLRHDGWSHAWEEAGVFDAVRRGDDGELDALATELAAAHPASADDVDRVVLLVRLTVQPDEGEAWQEQCSLDLVGRPEETAMATLVSTPLVQGINSLLAGDLAPGLHRATTERELGDTWLAGLQRRDLGLRLPTPR